MPDINNSIYKESRNLFIPGANLPKVSNGLDSVRAYQFECRFLGLPIAASPGDVDDLTIAAKQVSPVAGAVEDIVVDRVNDKLFYPGKFTPESVQITFDNQLLNNNTLTLWNWFKEIYNPMTGELISTQTNRLRLWKCQQLRVLELNNVGRPHSYIDLYGVYPSSVRYSEKNYSTNEFSTVEVGFRFDFVDYGKIN